MTMTPRQMMALAFPCARAADTVQNRFHQMHPYQRRANIWWSSILTINR